MTPKCSIIMNCYNGEKYLREAIESIVDQTYENWELIFIDNQSNDKSFEIFNRYSDRRLRYYKTPNNLVLGAARQMGVEKCTGDFVCFLDTDDLWVKNKLELQIKWLNKNSSRFCYAGINEITPDGHIIRQVKPLLDGANFETQLKKFEINMVTPIISLKLLKDYNLSFNPNIVASEEYNLFLRILAKENGTVMPDVLGSWRIYPGSLTQRAIGSLYRDRMITLNQLKKENKNVRTMHKQAFSSALARGLYYQACAQMHFGNKKFARCALIKAATHNKVYLIMVVFTLSTKVWEFLHEPKRKRMLVNIFKFDYLFSR